MGRLPKGVAAPGYDRADLSPGIVHIGVGNFHRAHQAVYLDDLFASGRDHDWAIIGAGVREYDIDMRAKLAAQDWLTTVVEQEAQATTVRVTGPMIDFVKPFDVAAMLEMLSRPAIRIVSLTVTEGGYCIDPATQKFDPRHPEIAYDAAHFDAPKSAFGLIAAGLKRRRQAGVAPFTVMSCDNIPGNGHVCENAVAGLAELVDPELCAWIRVKVAFPNSMVDRITPATGDRERAILKDQYGVEDNFPVFCEEFRQWVIEDRFPAGRPALETRRRDLRRRRRALRADEDPHPQRRPCGDRLSGRAARHPFRPRGDGGQADRDLPRDADQARDPAGRAAAARRRSRGLSPARSPSASPTRRSATRSRACASTASNRQPKFILPSVVDRLKAGQSFAGLALVSAMWCRYCYGESESGKTIPPNDPSWDRLQQAARSARADPRAFLAMRDIFGALSDTPAYVAAFSNALTKLWSQGVRATLDDYLAGRL